MKKYIVLLLFLAGCLPLAFAQTGIPFFRNFTSQEYGAHNRNFDVVCDSTGTPYFANFEGIIYFNGAQWNKILTPGISRITKLHIDHTGRIWAGGYNYIGWIDCEPNGTPILHSLLSDKDIPEEKRIGEVLDIQENGNTLTFSATNYQAIYIIGKEELSIEQTGDASANTQFLQLNAHSSLRLPDNTFIESEGNNGIIGYDAQGNRLFQITEENGLCSNTINRITFDGQGKIWGATDNGVFSIQWPSFFTHFTPNEGLKGEVICVARHQHTLYAGTLHGLFRFDKNKQQFVPMPDMTQSCWQLTIGTDGTLYAATSKGVYAIKNEKAIQKQNDIYTLSIAFNPQNPEIRYSGEMDGVYRTTSKGKKKIADIEQATKMEFAQESLWIETLYGEIYQIDNKLHITQRENGNSRLYISPEKEVFVLNIEGYSKIDNTTLNGQATPMAKNDEGSDWWPGFAAHTPSGNEKWVVNGSGRGIHVLTENKLNTQKTEQLLPLNNYIVRTLYLEDNNHAWIGGDFGLIHINLTAKDGAYRHTPDVFIRSIVLNRDSVYFGGYNQDLALFTDLIQNAVFPSNINNFEFQFSTNTDNINTNANYIQYAYYLEGYEQNWSAWQTASGKEYTNLSHGNYIFHIKTKDAFGRESEEKSYAFRIEKPIYLTWYAIVCYIALGIALVLAFVRWRIQALQKEKERLEEIVKSRTAEVVRQRDEIVEKSERLEKALGELKEAQDQLIRQEKAAMMGKLTGGLIDRILNPLNYIINFSHLSILLLKDMKEDIEDEEENISEDNYEDMQEILSMMDTHLSKIEEHGNSTSRILKAMEEMLADHRINLVPTDINHLCVSNLNVLKEYYKKEIEEMNIRVLFHPQEDTPLVEADKIQLGKSILSMLQNCIYAVRKKWEKQPYEAEISLSIGQEEDNSIAIRIRDNGIGIEKGILDKIFDPFFTTKTTSEAAGVGLYLSREIILSHHGTLGVKSEKDIYTEFTIKLNRYHGDEQ